MNPFKVRWVIYGAFMTKRSPLSQVSGGFGVSQVSGGFGVSLPRCL